MHPVTSLWLVLALITPARALDYPDELVARARSAKLAERPEWRALLHYEPRSFGGVKSTADSGAFFADPSGKTDPEAELAATVRAFFAPPGLETSTSSGAASDREQHPQCRFRARYLWLSDVLGFDPARLVPAACARFRWWSDRLAARSVTLVFASAYLNNPASMFGHTFLRLNRKARGQGPDLVAYTVNFAADPTTSNPLFYAALGLTGGFAGGYSTLPYYLKVKEYTSLEHRDLWEYDLDLTPAEIERLIAHLWELGSVDFDYWYLDENCSYQLLSLLEAARPSLDLTARFTGWVIPSDTLREVLAAPGLVSGVGHRPSEYQVMLALRRAIEGDEPAFAEAIAAGLRPPPEAAALEPRRGAAVLDAALGLLRFRARRVPTDESRAREQAILRARGSIPVASVPVSVESPDPPERGHATALVGLGAGADGLGPFLAITGRAALHDLVDRPEGYVPGSEIEFFRFRARVPLRIRAPTTPQLDSFRLLGIVSIAPIDPWAFRWSWRLFTGVERRFDGGCRGSPCLFYELRGGPGLAVALDRAERAVAFAFLDASVGAGPAFSARYRVAGGISAGMLLTIARPLRFLFEASYLYPALGDGHPSALPGDGPADAPYALRGALAFDLSDRVELRADVFRARGYQSAACALLHYF